MLGSRGLLPGRLTWVVREGEPGAGSRRRTLDLGAAKQGRWGWGTCWALTGRLVFTPIVALNYQSEGRMLQLNRAKFSANGNCGYVLKPECMCQGEPGARGMGRGLRGA